MTDDRKVIPITDAPSLRGNPHAASDREWLCSQAARQAQTEHGELPPVIKPLDADDSDPYTGLHYVPDPRDGGGRP